MHGLHCADRRQLLFEEREEETADACHGSSVFGWESLYHTCGAGCESANPAVPFCLEHIYGMAGVWNMYGKSISGELGGNVFFHPVFRRRGGDVGAGHAADSGLDFRGSMCSDFYDCPLLAEPAEGVQAAIFIRCFCCTGENRWSAKATGTVETSCGIRMPEDRCRL